MKHSRNEAGGAGGDKQTRRGQTTKERGARSGLGIARLPSESGEEGTPRTELGEKEMKGGRRQAVVRTDAIPSAREEGGDRLTDGLIAPGEQRARRAARVKGRRNKGPVAAESPLYGPISGGFQYRPSPER